MDDKNAIMPEGDEKAIENRRAIGVLILAGLLNVHFALLWSNPKALREWLSDKFDQPWADIVGYIMLVVGPIVIVFAGGEVLRKFLRIPVRKAVYDRAAKGRIAGLVNCAFWGVVIAIGLVLTEPARTVVVAVSLVMTIVGFGVSWWWGGKGQ
jgi:hypothetical protein